MQLNFDYLLINSIASQNTIEDILIYPNPTNDFISVLISPSVRIYEIILYNIKGDKILTTNENLINIGSLPHGVYLIRIIADNLTYEKKIIKQNRL